MFSRGFLSLRDPGSENRGYPIKDYQPKMWHPSGDQFIS
jgi:hypothetical protein